MNWTLYVAHLDRALHRNRGAQVRFILRGPRVTFLRNCFWLSFKVCISFNLAKSTVCTSLVPEVSLIGLVGSSLRRSKRTRETKPIRETSGTRVSLYRHSTTGLNIGIVKVQSSPEVKVSAFYAFYQLLPPPPPPPPPSE